MKILSFGTFYQLNVVALPVVIMPQSTSAFKRPSDQTREQQALFTKKMLASQSSMEIALCSRKSYFLIIRTRGES